jgi:hypothetical protein
MAFHPVVAPASKTHRPPFRKRDHIPDPAKASAPEAQKDSTTKARRRHEGHGEQRASLRPLVSSFVPSW